MLLAGLDIETTGTDLNAGHRLIQIGISVLDIETGTVNDYSSDVRPVGKVAIDEGALKVNKFTKKRISNAPSQTAVDTMIWSEMLKVYKHDSLIPVGWNVILFDMPFIRRELPLIAGMFTYPTPQRSTRAIDLMSLGLYYSHLTGKPYEGVRDDVRAEVAKRMGVNNEHDALYDAKAALEALNVYKELMGAKI